MEMSYEEYNRLVGTTESIKKMMTPGCYYYIEDTSRKQLKYREVYHGKYLRREDKVNVFENVKFIVNPFQNTAKPRGFYGRFKKYIPDNSMPCDEDTSNKTKAVAELNTEFDELRVRPVEENESNISFIGEDYRKAKQEFYDNTKNEPSGGKKQKHTKRNTKRNTKRRRIRKRTQKKRHNK
jgi:hypothetical protein